MFFKDLHDQVDGGTQRRHMQLEGLQSLSDNQPARLSAVVS
jgi:hypothetical protein